MSNSRSSDGRQSENREDFESNAEDENTHEIYRDYNENERPLLRSRAQRALTDLSAREGHEDDKQKKQEIEAAIEHLERIIECMADNPLRSIASDVLETEEWLEYDDLRTEHSVSGSMPMLLEAFVILVENGVTPGQWILEPLAEAFGRILEDQDPEMVASRLGLQAKGSGSGSPLKDYPQQLERASVYFDMRTLIEDFGISQTNAAHAVIEKFDLKLAAKTLVNKYQPRAKHPALVRELLDKYSDGLGGPVVWLSNSGRKDFLDSFPTGAQKFLRSKRPPKT